MATQPIVASPGDAQGNPAVKQSLGMLTQIASMTKQYAQAYPQCADEMKQIGVLLQQCLMKSTGAQAPGESPAPPV